MREYTCVYRNRSSVTFRKINHNQQWQKREYIALPEYIRIHAVAFFTKLVRSATELINLLNLSCMNCV